MTADHGPDHPTITSSPRQITATDLDRWLADGVTVIEGFLSSQATRQVREHIRLLYQDEPECLHGPATREDGHGMDFHDDQFRGLKSFPYPGGTALNLVGLDPRILDAARSALQTDDILMHQNLTHVKHSGLANYEQPLHLDYPLHTLLMPSRQPRFRTVIFTLFLTDVGPQDGPFAYIPKPHTTHLDPTRSVLDEAGTRDLLAFERKVTVPAGTLLMYGPDDVYHRGTNITGPDAFRWSVTSSFYAAECQFMGGLRWFSEGLNKAWPSFISHATPEQLKVIGIPLPGHPYWTESTIRGVQHRYPDWDPRPWLDALGS